ncbi:AT-hook motif nuclear-localized protein 1 [Linum grandiflorum]
METREGLNTGVTVIGAEAPSAYHVAPRGENPNQIGGGVSQHHPQQQQQQMMVLSSPATGEKKKRGRPRKYAPDGAAGALSPMPISASAPPASGGGGGGGGGDYSNSHSIGGKPSKVASAAGYEKKKHKKIGMENSVGTNFTPHVIAVNAGEDVTMKVISFSQQGPRAICILSANGVISNVTLRQSDSSGGTLTYEGRFEILSLSGSFMPTESQGTRNRTGGMSVSLASPDGRVVGGSVAGLLIAATPVQVVVGSFLPGNNQPDPKPKKVKMDPHPAPVDVTTSQAPQTMTPSSIHGSAHMERDENNHMGGGQHMQQQQQPNSYRRDTWAAYHSMADHRNSGTDINISLPEG